MRNFSYTSNFAKTGTIIEYISFKKILLATIIWSISVVFIFPFFSILLGIFLASVVVLIMIKLSNRKLGGITGDILGATAFLTELAFMLGLVIYLGSIF